VVHDALEHSRHTKKLWRYALTFALLFHLHLPHFFCSIRLFEVQKVDSFYFFFLIVPPCFSLDIVLCTARNDDCPTRSYEKLANKDTVLVSSSGPVSVFEENLYGKTIFKWKLENISWQTKFNAVNSSRFSDRLLGSVDHIINHRTLSLSIDVIFDQFLTSSLKWHTVLQ
jgi:hypothetical protein